MRKQAREREKERERERKRERERPSTTLLKKETYELSIRNLMKP